MNSENIYQNKSFVSIDGSLLVDDDISRHVPSFEVTDKSKDEIDNLTSRMTFIDDAISENFSKKSFLLLRKHYPNYHHYSHNADNLKRLPKFGETHVVLPQIKGRTLSHAEAEAALSKKIHGNISHQISTLQDLTNSILRYGGKTDVVCMKFANNRNGHKLVRPGFSARRYMANLVRYLNDDLVDKLISEGRILEKTIFRQSVLLPHIRRRISADLSRYPEPYRILKQMLMAPGPLNEYSFVWRKKSIESDDDDSPSKVPELKIGFQDIKILSKKHEGTDKEAFEEVQYDTLTHDKKKTVLTNILLKSAMNHALKMKDEIIDHNLKVKESSKEPVQNVHIPVIKFDMMEAVTDLLNKETFETLSTKLVPSVAKSGFRGQALRTSTHTDIKSPATPQQEIPKDHVNVIDIDQIQQEEHLHPPTSDISGLPHLTLRLHQTNVSKGTYKKKVSKAESISAKQSTVSNSNSVFGFNPSEQGLPDFQSIKEAQANAFIERLKNKPAAPREIKIPYGRHRDFDGIGDLDPTLSFKTWKYDESKHTISDPHKPPGSPYLSPGLNRGIDSAHDSRSDKVVDKDSAKDHDSTEIQKNQNRLIGLLSEHAETVAEKVLQSSGGGEDFASDVNVAIMEILKQKNSLLNESNGIENPVWNVDVENMKNQEEYGEMIKTIFKSIFNDQLGGIASNDMGISPEIMALLQDGSKLSLDNIKVETDPITGQLIVQLRDEIPIKTGTDSVTNIGSINMPSQLGFSTPRNIANTIYNDSSYQRHHFSQSESSDQMLIEDSMIDRQGIIDAKKELHSFQSGLKFSQDHLGSQQQMGVFQYAEQMRHVVNSKVEYPDSSQEPLPSSKDGKSYANKNEKDGEINDLLNQLKGTIENTSTTKKKASKKVGKKKPKPEFVVGHVEEPNDTSYLASSSLDKADNVKLTDQPSQKLTEKQGKQKSKKLKSTKDGESRKMKKVSGEQNDDNEIRNSDDQQSQHNQDSRADDYSSSHSKDDYLENDEELNEYQISEENLSDEEGADEERKIFLRQQREAKRKADAEKRRLEVDFRRKEKEEKRKMENKRLEMEEILRKKLEDEKRQREEEYRLKMEKQRAEEQLRLDALKGQEYLRQKQIDKERREKEEFRRKVEEMKIKRELEEQRKRLEEELLALEEAERLRLEKEMLSRMQEQDRLACLKRKDEEEEQKRLKEEEERLLKEEQARLALEEARRIAQEQARERALIEARLNFVKGLKIENEGMKKYLNITPSFVWSYFEFLKVLGVAAGSIEKT